MKLITDRTQNHVTLLKQLQAKGWNNMTESEKIAWRNEAAKGAYNHTDLNRVESAVAELAVYFGLSLPTKTNWGMWDIPLKADMDRYLDNIVKIRNVCLDNEDIPSPPSSMNRLTYEDANNIEKILVAAYKHLERYGRCGEIFTGEV